MLLVLALGCDSGTDRRLQVTVIHPLPGSLAPTSGEDYVAGRVNDANAILTVNGKVAPVNDNGSFLVLVSIPDSGSVMHEVVATTGNDTARVQIPVASAGAREFARSATNGLQSEQSHARGISKSRARIVRVEPADDYATELVARVTEDGNYTWPLLPGTLGAVIDSLDGQLQVRISDSIVVWIDKHIARESMVGVVPMVQLRVVGIRSTWDGEEIRIRATRPPAYNVSTDGTALTFRVFGSASPFRSVLERPNYVKSITAHNDQEGVVFRISLRGPLFGYEVVWRDSAVVLRVRSPPVLDRKHPLRGLIVSIDPGHPPGGAIGPLGTREADIVLSIAKRLRRILVERGAHPVLTRIDDGHVSLAQRTSLARAVGAHALISIHLDAAPSGTNPFAMNRIVVYASNAHSVALAATTYSALERRLSRKGGGFAHGDFAIVRPTWAPAILTEAAVLTLPDQEAAVRTRRFQERHALGLADGLERYFRALSVEMH